MQSRAALAKKIRRLHLFKSLLSGNKFTKLARLGELNALGEYKYLEKLDELFTIGALSKELKEQLLLKLATAIKLCAALYVSSDTQAESLSAITTRVSPRTVLCNKKETPVFGGDPEFFQSDVPEVKASPSIMLRRSVYLRSLVRSRGKKFSSALSNCALAHTARAAKLTVISRLHRCRALLASAPKGGQSYANRTEHAELLLKRARRQSAHPTPRLYRASKHGARAPRFISLNSLPDNFAGVAATAAAPQI